MDILNGFLRSEINNQELYNDIMAYIISFHIREGEFEGNEYVIKKLDQTNFIIFSEYVSPNGKREIHGAISLYRRQLIVSINDYARTKGLCITEFDWYGTGDGSLSHEENSK